MKRANNAYRIQIIKEVALRKQRESMTDPMAKYINQIIEERPSQALDVERNQRFAGAHFDENAGGWVSDNWK